MIIENAIRMKSWSPYAVGAGIGALSWLTFATAKKPLGITSAFETAAAKIEQAWAPRLTRVNEYIKERDGALAIDWEWALVAGVFLGSYASSRLSGDRRHSAVPARWAGRFGESVLKRFAGAAAGGALMMFGARMAKGCTSGHGISGALQLALSSFTFSPLMFASAVATARALFGEERAR